MLAGLTWNLAQILVVPRGWIQRTLVTTSVRRISNKIHGSYRTFGNNMRFNYKSWELTFCACRIITLVIICPPTEHHHTNLWLTLIPEHLHRGLWSRPVELISSSTMMEQATKLGTTAAVFPILPDNSWMCNFSTASYAKKHILSNPVITSNKTATVHLVALRFQRLLSDVATLPCTSLVSLFGWKRLNLNVNQMFVFQSLQPLYRSDGVNQPCCSLISSSKSQPSSKVEL